MQLTFHFLLPASFLSFRLDLVEGGEVEAGYF